MAMAIGNSESAQPGDCLLGIDPGLNRTGYAILARCHGRPKLLEGGVLRSNSGKPLEQRIDDIASGLAEIIDEFHPSSLAIEQVFSMVRNPKSALLMAHARGGLLLTAARANLDVVHYSPTQIKRLLCGNGRATKVQIQRAVQRELALPEVLEPNDVADATAVALCHFHACRVATPR